MKIHFLLNLGHSVSNLPSIRQFSGEELIFVINEIKISSVKLIYENQ